MAIDEYNDDEDETTTVREGVEEIVMLRVVGCPKSKKQVDVGEKCSGCKYFEYMTLDSQRVGCSYTSSVDKK